MFSRRRRALARWPFRAEGGGVDPHTAAAVRVAFQASSIPDGFTFLVARFSVLGRDVAVTRSRYSARPSAPPAGDSLVRVTRSTGNTAARRKGGARARDEKPA